MGRARETEIVSIFLDENGSPGFRITPSIAQIDADKMENLRSVMRDAVSQADLIWKDRPFPFGTRAALRWKLHTFDGRAGRHTIKIMPSNKSVDIEVDSNGCFAWEIKPDIPMAAFASIIKPQE